MLKGGDLQECCPALERGGCHTQLQDLHDLSGGLFGLQDHGAGKLQHEYFL